MLDGPSLVVAGGRQALSTPLLAAWSPVGLGNPQDNCKMGPIFEKTNIVVTMYMNMNEYDIILDSI